MKSFSHKAVFTLLLFSLSLFFLYANGEKDVQPLSDEQMNNLPPLQIELPVASYKKQKIEGNPETFKEIWGYVSQYRQNDFQPDLPLTDVCIFCAEINCYGEIINIPTRKCIKDFSGRVHMVLNCDSKSLTHFILDPQYSVRRKIINQLVLAARLFDGIQLDFEYVPFRDRENFISFIKELQKKLGKGKWLSVCVPARISNITDDVYPYKRIAQFCDRIIVMAYDEHWSTSAPGSVASMDWCRKIAQYSLASVPPNKLIMGLPFYGRTWIDKNPAGGWSFNKINQILQENKIKKINRIDYTPSFKYITEITVNCWFEDDYSLITRCRMYSGMNINKIAFWRIGQEDPDFWQWIKIQEN